MKLFLACAISSTLVIGIAKSAHTQTSIEPLEVLFDDCLTVIISNENATRSTEERVTDFGTVTIGIDGDSCIVAGYSVTPNSYEIAGDSQIFTDRFVSWLRSRESDFDQPRIFNLESGLVVLTACVTDVWQVIASSSTVDALATETMRNDPRWLTDFAKVSTAVFFVEGQRGNTCEISG